VNRRNLRRELGQALPNRLLGEFEEAVGVLEQFSTAESRLVLGFEWGQISVQLCSRELKLARRALNHWVGKKIALLYLTDSVNHVPALKMRRLEVGT